jgi:type 1 glutamine amidotransferase
MAREEAPLLLHRHPLTSLALLTIAGVAVSTMGASVASLPAAQASTRTVTPAQAAPFIGDWTAPIASQLGPSTYAISVKVSNDKVVATITPGIFPPTAASDISLSGQNLFLKFTSDFQGMAIPGLVAMTPKGQEMLLTISLLDGQLEMAGTATKGSPAASGAMAAGRGQAGRGGAQGAGRGSAQPQVARVTDLMQMMTALPESAPAAPKQPRTVLVLAKAAGFVHSSIPLAARTIEAMGQKTGAWNTVITYNVSDITEQNLQNYDAIFLASTTGTFLDDPADQAVTAARRKALLDFVRGGKGIAGVHAATDSYHGAAPAEQRAAAPAPAPGARPAVDGGSPLWPEFNRLIGGYFKYHWLYPTQIAVKIDDPDNPVNASFTSLNKQTGVRLPRPFSIVDEVYTFNESSFSRDRVHVLTSIDYAKMPAEVKAQEPAPQRTDHDYALSYIQREGKGRVFVEVLGHDESIYKMPSILAHILAGMQYALGDLQADDSPTNAPKQ